MIHLPRPDQGDDQCHRLKNNPRQWRVRIQNGLTFPKRWRAASVSKCAVMWAKRTGGATEHLETGHECPGWDHRSPPE